jgi:hypothetical protein
LGSWYIFSLFEVTAYLAIDIIVRFVYHCSKESVLNGRERKGDGAMRPEEMDRLIEEHLAAEKAGDTVRAVSMYTEDVEHDVVSTTSLDRCSPVDG